MCCFFPFSLLKYYFSTKYKLKQYFNGLFKVIAALVRKQYWVCFIQCEVIRVQFLFASKRVPLWVSQEPKKTKPNAYLAHHNSGFSNGWRSINHHIQETHCSKVKESWHERKWGVKQPIFQRRCPIFFFFLCSFCCGSNILQVICSTFWMKVKQAAALQNLS